MISKVGLPLQMEAEKSVNHIRTKDLAVFAGSILQSIGQKRKQRTAQPFMRRNIEPSFWTLQDGLRQLVFHQLL